MDVLQMSISASVLIVVVVVIRTLCLYRLSKKTFLVLWGIVLCRLLIPITIPSRFSFYTGINTIKRIFAERADVLSSAGIPGIPDMANMPGVEEPMGAGASAAISPVEIVWLAGMCACALFFIVAYIKCRREFKMSLPVGNNVVTRWLREHPLRRPVQIRQSDRIKAPLTYGVFRPMILLQKKTNWTDEVRLKVVLTHEFVHIRRFDTLTKLVLTAAVCVHWFNPFVWVMYVLANRDIELSCDETVVRTFGETIKSVYALTLIGLEEKKSRFTPLVSNFSKNAVEERIVSIMKTKKTSLMGIVLALVLVAGTVTVFATSAAAATDNSISSGIAIADNSTGLISADGGQTWMDEEEYQKMYPTPDIIWWTYDEYKEWLDNEKIQLQSIIGEKGWNPTDGGYVWTQEKVDETIKMYEGLLEDIKNGMKLSKTVDGSNEVVVAFNPSDIAKTSGYEVVIVNDTGVEAHFGPCDTKEELLTQVRPYCDEQVKTGNMTQREADEILSQYQ